MKQFAALYQQLDQTNGSNEKVQLLKDFFEHSRSDSDKMWAIALFTHRRPSRPVSTTLLRQWCAEVSGIPLWLLEQNYHIVGDLAETLALVLPPPSYSNENNLSYWIQTIIQLKDKSEEIRKSTIVSAWSMMNTMERLVFNKLITGGFRVGVSEKSIHKALAQVLHKDENQVAHMLSGHWTPDTLTWKQLKDKASEDVSKPYPFYLAYPLESNGHEGIPDIRPEEWAAEWKWDGIRCQWIMRNQQIFLWSRGEELITDKFPELTKIADSVQEDAVIDGELIVQRNDVPLDFAELQKRISRKNVTSAILKNLPARIIAYDLLEYAGTDIRHWPFLERRNKLMQILEKGAPNPYIQISPLVPFGNAEELITWRTKSREYRAEGLMLKKWDEPYHTGRKKGGMWKWKVDPYTVDAVMIYAQRGHGRRANLYSDFTFAVWDNDRLVPFTKAYSGLTDSEMNEITAFVRKNTLENFGPVASVRPDLVFELAFEGIQASSRHKAGVALRFPRIKRWRKDKIPAEADTLERLKMFL